MNENERNDDNDNNGENVQRGCDVHPVHSVRKHQSLSQSEEFLCLDFTVDLDIAIDEQGKFY